MADLTQSKSIKINIFKWYIKLKFLFPLIPEKNQSNNIFNPDQYV